MVVDARVQLEVLYNFIRSLSGQLGLRDILRRVVKSAVGTASADYGSVVAFSADGEMAGAEVLCRGQFMSEPESLVAPALQDGLPGYVLHNREVVVLKDVSQDPRWTNIAENDICLPDRGSALSTPLIHGNRVVGTLTLANPAPAYFDPGLVELISVMGDQAAVAIANALLFRDMQRAEARYVNLFDDSIVPIILTDMEGMIIEANRRACQFFEYDRASLLRLPITAIHRMGTGPVGHQRFAHLQRGREVKFETTAWTRSGKEIIVQVHAKRIQGEQNDVVQWIEHDLTTQRELDQLRSDLSDMIYHDLRNPLSNVITSLDVLNVALAHTEDEKVRAVLEIGTRASRQLSRLVDSLLDLRRLEEGKTILQRERTPVSRLVAEAAQQVHVIAREQDLDMRFNLANDLPYLYIDADMVKRVLINLMENAIKYTPPGGGDPG
ncbi:MAG: GAF domain-containing protein [Anaerolineae bacterium]|nr:GAF domain-containing protein [Anaerolineae bacterium]